MNSITIFNLMFAPSNRAPEDTLGTGKLFQSRLFCSESVADRIECNNHLICMPIVFFLND